MRERKIFENLYFLIDYLQKVTSTKMFNPFLPTLEIYWYRHDPVVMPTSVSDATTCTCSDASNLSRYYDVVLNETSCNSTEIVARWLGSVAYSQFKIFVGAKYFDFKREQCLVWDTSQSTKQQDKLEMCPLATPVVGYIHSNRKFKLHFTRIH